jgi:hypothetical protein
MPPACARQHTHRAWSDPQMYTHVALLPGLCITLHRDPSLPELLVLQCAVCVLSLLYHRNCERPCALASVEHSLAYGLFLYGVVQTFHSPSAWIICANITCACFTSLAYVLTNVNRKLWDVWHPIGLHVVPGLWSCLIAAYHRPLL